MNMPLPYRIEILVEPQLIIDRFSAYLEDKTDEEEIESWTHFICTIDGYKNFGDPLYESEFFEKFDSM